ncbi:MAG: ATP-binding cassette domain-containing protein [Deltaproteobacteria bacterium]|nr:MAG: ATP-binding cassette domain-containing protein [Deltaproteobacteria bacterium]
MTPDPSPTIRGLDLRRVASLARPELRRLVLGTIALSISAGMTLSYPWFVERIVDGVLAGQGRDALDGVILVLLGLFLVGSVMGALRAWWFTVAGERIVTDLRRRLYAAIMAQEIAFFDERRTGELTNRLASDATVLQNTVTVNVSMALRYAVMCVGAVVILVATSWQLTLVMLAVVPVVVIAATIYGRLLRRISRRFQDALAAATTVAEETISGIRTVRSFAREQAEVARYGAAVERAYELARQRARVAAIFRGTAGFFSYAAIAAVLWTGGLMLSEGRMTMGELTSFLLYTLTVAVSLGALSSLWEDFAKAIGASQRVFELLDRTPRIRSGTRRLDHPRGEIELQDVHFAYPSRPGHPVLDGISMHLRPGTVTALVGPSGAGKSTVAALLSRFYDPQQGRILFDGVDLRELDLDALRRQVGVVRQEPVLFALSIRDNIRYGRPDATDAEVEAAARAANAHDFIMQFPEGYDTLVGERGVRLSGGQKQRVAIARALLQDPRVLVLDEATSALDAESEHLVQEALERLMEGRTTVVIAHRLSTVKAADRILVFDGGRICEAGTHQELLARGGLYRQLVERQFAA